MRSEVTLNALGEILWRTHIFMFLFRFFAVDVFVSFFFVGYSLFSREAAFTGRPCYGIVQAHMYYVL